MTFQSSTHTLLLFLALEVISNKTAGFAAFARDAGEARDLGSLYRCLRDEILEEARGMIGGMKAAEEAAEEKG